MRGPRGAGEGRRIVTHRHITLLLFELPLMFRRLIETEAAAHRGIRVCASEAGEALTAALRRTGADVVVVHEAGRVSSAGWDEVADGCACPRVISIHSGRDATVEYRMVPDRREFSSLSAADLVALAAGARGDG